MIFLRSGFDKRRQSSLIFSSFLDLVYYLCLFLYSCSLFCVDTQYVNLWINVFRVSYDKKKPPSTANLVCRTVEFLAKTNSAIHSSALRYVAFRHGAQSDARARAKKKRHFISQLKVSRRWFRNLEGVFSYCGKPQKVVTARNLFMTRTVLCDHRTSGRTKHRKRRRGRKRNKETKN